jgi:hypothetical protein
MMSGHCTVFISDGLTCLKIVAKLSNLSVFLMLESVVALELCSFQVVLGV